jgi:hypothetical protein
MSLLLHPHLSPKRILRFWTVVLLSTGLYAADRVVLIDQDKAMSGNVTPGDEAGFPVTLSQSGSYRLTGNLTLPDNNTTGIEITADHVTIDLNGFSIIGPVVCHANPTGCSARGNGIGILAGDIGTAGRQGIKILNGSITGVGLDGIQITGDGNFIEKVTADSNGRNGILLTDGTVVDCVAMVNGSTGIAASSVRGSTAGQNRVDGIRVTSLATGNVASANGLNGISAFNSTISNNTVQFNVQYGIDGGCPSSIVGNTALSNQAGNINISGPSCVLSNNAQQ